MINKDTIRKNPRTPRVLDVGPAGFEPATPCL